MGGRALKNTFTRRYEKAEFEVISEELITKLREHFTRVEMPLYYSSKESFGDADILVDVTDFKHNMVDFIEGNFKPNEIFHNGNCWSFDYKELQVDLITTKGLDFDTNYHYLAYNDLGNFIGRIAHLLGLKYGQEGLWYEHYFKGQNIGRVEVSRDYEKIFDFLGFSYDEWLKGFVTLEDVFEYVTKNKYFDYEMFQLKSLNKINRERNVKRASYMSFLDYIELNHKDKSHKVLDKDLELQKAKDFFPESNITMKIRELEYLYSRKMYANSKFNGYEITKRFGLTGKELGESIVGFKKTATEHGLDFESFIIDTDIDNLYSLFAMYAMANLIDKEKGL